MRLVGRILLTLLVVITVAAVAGGCYVRAQLRASLPLLEGTITLAGLSAPVTVTRDALGVPTITGAAARRRRARARLPARAGSFLPDGPAAPPAGRRAEPRWSALARSTSTQEVRVHRFRHVAQQALERTEPEWKARARRLCRRRQRRTERARRAAVRVPHARDATPEPWNAEDSILTVLAMFNTLQGRQAAVRTNQPALRDTLPEPMFRFLTAADRSGMHRSIG